MSDLSAVLYDYENRVIGQPAYWRVGAVEFADIDERAAFLYDDENATT